MRVYLAALAIAAAVASPASAQESCPIGKAVYSFNGPTPLNMTFFPDLGGQSMNGVRALISAAGQPVAAMDFSWGNRGPVSATPGGPVLAFNRDFEWEGMATTKDAAAPYALIFPDATLEGAEPGAWILTDCR